MTGTTMANVTGLLTATNPKMPKHTKPVCSRKTTRKAAVTCTNRKIAGNERMKRLQ